MEKPYVLHIVTPSKHVSPFDVHMGYDAGWSAITPYPNVELDEVSMLIQDAIFSRGPKGVQRTGIFLGGRDMALAIDMLEYAKEAMVPPFEVSVFADPSGAFTTAAALIAIVERQLRDTHQTTLGEKKVVVLGGTGPVGSVAAIIAAKIGADVSILGRQKDKADRVAAQCNDRYGGDMTLIKGDVNDNKGEHFKDADIVLGTAKAGVEVMSESDVSSASKLKVVADVNAVPPAGIAGVGAQDDGKSLPGSQSGAVGIGALAIGNVKYQTQQQLLIRMRESDSPEYLHFEHAFEFARDYVSSD